MDHGGVFVVFAVFLGQRTKRRRSKLFSTGVLYRLVWLKIDGTGLDGLFHLPGPSINPKGHLCLSDLFPKGHLCLSDLR